MPRGERKLAGPFDIHERIKQWHLTDRTDLHYRHLRNYTRIRHYASSFHEFYMTWSSNDVNVKVKGGRKKQLDDPSVFSLVSPIRYEAYSNKGENFGRGRERDPPWFTVRHLRPPTFQEEQSSAITSSWPCSVSSSAVLRDGNANVTYDEFRIENIFERDLYVHFLVLPVYVLNRHEYAFRKIVYMIRIHVIQWKRRTLERERGRES